MVGTALLFGTPVATAGGWRLVETLDIGDRLRTIRGGFVAVVALHSADLDGSAGADTADRWPLHIPAGVMGNRNDLRLLPDQPVLLSSDVAGRMFGNPMVWFPAGVLAGWRGVTQQPLQGGDRIATLILATDAMVHVAGGALLAFRGARRDPEPGATPAFLSPGAADAFVAALIAEDMGAVLMGTAPRSTQAAFRVPAP